MTESQVRITITLTPEHVQALLVEDRGIHSDINRHAYWADASYHPPFREQAAAMAAAYTAIAEQLSAWEGMRGD